MISFLQNELAFGIFGSAGYLFGAVLARSFKPKRDIIRAIVTCVIVSTGWWVYHHGI